jgi:hypothetical protein
MRANGIPSRLLVGRWSQSDVPGYGQWHVKSDFYDPSVGYIPVDVSDARAKTIENNDVYASFGHLNGDFITMETNSDVRPEENWCVPVHQGAIFTFEGSEPFKSIDFKEQWSVTTLDSGE